MHVIIICKKGGNTKKMEFSEKLRNLRKEKGMTQKELSVKLGTTPQNLAQYENGKRNPKPKTLQKIADALDVPVNALKSDRELEFDNLMTTIKSINDAVDRSIELEQTLITDYRSLNLQGQEKAREQMKLLTKIPEYRKKDDAPVLNAAHDNGATPDQKKNADDIMKNSNE